MSNEEVSETATRIIAPEPGRLKLDHYIPSEPGAGEVAGSTIATLISPGTELAMAFGSDAGDRFSFPLEIGYASVFRVEKCGAGVEGVGVGDVVFSMGTHASFQCVDAKKVTPVPIGLDPSVAVFARMMNVPLAALVTSPVRPGQRVGVFGLGLIGQMAVRVFLASGFEVVAADPSEQRRGFLPAGTRAESTLEGAELDLIVECSGKEDAMLACARGLRKGGELVLTGVPWARRSDAHLHDLVNVIFHRYLHVRSGWEWQVPFDTGMPAAGPSTSQNLRRALTWLADGTVAVDALSVTVRPESAIDAFDALRERSAPALTYVIRWG